MLSFGSKDPADFLLQNGKEAFQTLLNASVSFLEYKCDFLVQAIGIEKIIYFKKYPRGKSAKNSKSSTVCEASKKKKNSVYMNLALIFKII